MESASPQNSRTALNDKDLPRRSKPTSKQANPKTKNSPTVLPDFIQERNAFFDELKKIRDQEIGLKPRRNIKITFKASGIEDLTLEGKTWETTPGQLLRHIPKEIAAGIVVSKIDNKIWDLDRRLEDEGKITVRLLSTKDPEGREVFWHSSAHVLGAAAEHEYGCRLSHGPPTDQGFFYDMALDMGRAIQEDDWHSLESRVKKFVKEKQGFERLSVSKDNLRKMFSYSRHKMHYVEKFISEGGSSTVYRNGLLVDLCQGPHIQNTRKIEAFKITSVRHPSLVFESRYW